MSGMYSLNSQSLGVTTLVVSVAEFTALITNTSVVRQRGGLYITRAGLFGSLGSVMLLTFFVSSTVLATHEILILLAMFIFCVFREYSYLNLLVLSLDFCPVKLDSLALSFSLYIKIIERI